MTEQFAGKRFKRIIAHLKERGGAVESAADYPALYTLMAQSEGLEIPIGFVPSANASRRALMVYELLGALPDLAKLGTLSRAQVEQCTMGIELSREGLLTLVAQSHRNGPIVRLYLAQKRRCHYCRCEMLLSQANRSKPQYATIDHVIPRVEGGKKTKDNIVAACASCNNRKGHMAYHLFMVMVGGAA